MLPWSYLDKRLLFVYLFRMDLQTIVYYTNAHHKIFSYMTNHNKIKYKKHEIYKIARTV